MSLTSRQRLLRTLRGEPCDRAPVWLTGTAFNQESVEDPFREGWLASDRNLLAVKEAARGRREIVRIAGFTNHVLNTLFVIPPGRVRRVRVDERGDTRLHYSEIDTPQGVLTFVDRADRGVATTWRVKYPVESGDDLRKILSIPFALQEPDPGPFHAMDARLGAEGLLYVPVPSPFACVCNMMPLDYFLLRLADDRPLVEEMIQEACARVLSVLERLLRSGVGPLFRLHEAEHGVPPICSPRIYHELVAPYDARLIARIHAAGAIAAYHCHGRLAAVIDRMVEMGVDLLEPVEGPPQGDITFADARRRARGRTTLAGNVQLQDLDSVDAREIERQVRAILAGWQEGRVILATTEGPQSAPSDRMRDNYLALLDAAQRWGA